MGWYDYGDWKPYVPAAERRRRAKRKMDALRKKGVGIQPVEIAGRKIATTFWGEAWCDHLESFSDFANRLPRGRTYVRNGSVCHLAMNKGRIEAKVSGSELYDVKITIKPLAAQKWLAIKRRSSGQIGSLLELLQGKLSDHVMEVVTDRKEGLFPLPGEMKFQCSCPDWAEMCKHVAAVLYGVGARLDRKPELLFTLRGVNHEELIETDAEKAVTAATSRGKSKRLAASELSAVFGIEMDAETAGEPSELAAPKAVRKNPASRSRTAKKSAKKSAKKKATKKSPSKETVQAKGKTSAAKRPNPPKPAATKRAKKPG